MKKNILILLIFFLSLLKVGHLFYKWIKDKPKIEHKKEVISRSMFTFNKLNLLDGSWIHKEDSPHWQQLKSSLKSGCFYMMINLIKVASTNIK